MKQSEVNHLRLLLGWVRCEMGQDPDEMVTVLQDIAEKLGHPSIDDDAKRRLVEYHDRSRTVPKYIRAAVKALEKLTGPGAVIDDAEPKDAKLIPWKAAPCRCAADPMSATQRRKSPPQPQGPGRG